MQSYNSKALLKKCLGLSFKDSMVSANLRGRYQALDKLKEKKRNKQKPTLAKMKEEERKFGHEY